MSDAEKLAAAEALDRAIAESDAFHLARQLDVCAAAEQMFEGGRVCKCEYPHCDCFTDETTELRKAALNRGQP